MRKPHPIFSTGREIGISRIYIPRVVEFFTKNKGNLFPLLEDFPINVEMFKETTYVEAGETIKIIDYIPFVGITEFAPAEDTVVLEYNGKEYCLDASLVYALIVNDPVIREAIDDNIQRVKKRAKIEEERGRSNCKEDDLYVPSFSPFSDLQPTVNPAPSAGNEGEGDDTSYFFARGQEMAKSIANHLKERRENEET